VASSNKADVVGMLRQQHERIRTGLRAATGGSPAVDAAVKRLGQLCLPHFEAEEKIVFPVLEKMYAHVMITAEMHERAAELGRQRKRFGRDHEAIISAARVLHGAADIRWDRELAGLADMIAHHEHTENDLGMATYELGIAGRSRT
jgi:hypothetical protein